MVHISSHTQVAESTSPAPMSARCRLHNHHRGGPNTTKTTTITVVVPTRQKCRYSNPTRSWLFRISEWLFTSGVGAQYHIMKPKRMGKHQRKIQWHSGIESHKRSGGDADPPLSGNNEKCVCVEEGGSVEIDEIHFYIYVGMHPKPVVIYSIFSEYKQWPWDLYGWKIPSAYTVYSVYTVHPALTAVMLTVLKQWHTRFAYDLYWYMHRALQEYGLIGFMSKKRDGVDGYS